MKSRLIVNPVSGTDSAPDYLPVMNEQLRQRVGSLDIVITVAEGDATRAAREAVRDGYDHLFVGGGDGTLNEVLNGVGEVSGGFEAVTFGIIPLGTGNDFATALGMPDEVAAAIEVLTGGVAVAVDVGQLNDRYFINVSAGGFIAEVSDAVNPRLKTIAGKLAYLIGGAQALLQHEPVGATFRTPRTSRPTHTNITTFAVCNSKLVGGGRLIAPDAVIDDGLLDICLIESMPTVEFVALLTRVSNGEHVSDERVTYFRVREIDFTFDRTIKVNTDGQVLETPTCRYRVLPGVARFIAPVAGSRGSTRRDRLDNTLPDRDDDSHR